MHPVVLALSIPWFRFPRSYTGEDEFRTPEVTCALGTCPGCQGCLRPDFEAGDPLSWTARSTWPFQDSKTTCRLSWSPGRLELAEDKEKHRPGSLRPL